MSHADIAVCGSMATLGVLIYARGRRPLLKLQRGITRLRAFGYLLAEMADGARSRTNRWKECKARAEREL